MSELSEINIFIVSEHADPIKIAMEVLREYDLSYRIFSSIPEMLQMLPHQRISVLIVDATQSSAPPLQQLDQIRHIDLNSPPRIIFLTANNNMTDNRELLANGAADVLAWDDLDHLPWVLQRELENVKRIEAQIDKAVRISDEKFSKAFISSPDSIAIATVVEGRIIDINDSFVQQIGYTRDELIGSTSLNLWATPEDRQQIIKSLQENGHLRNEEVHYRRKNGEIRTALMSSELIELNGTLCSISLLRDITERKEIENQLRHSEMRYRAIVEDQSELICRYTSDFRLTFVNRAYSQKYGKTPEELIGVNLIDLIDAKDRRQFQIAIEKLTKDNPVTSREHRSILPDGRVSWQYWSDRAIFDKDDNIVEYQGVGRDITESKVAQDRLNFLHALILATSTATSIENALESSMRLICEAQGWDYGEAWMMASGDDVLRSAAAFYIHPNKQEAYCRFREITEDYIFTIDSGIPGRTWARQSAEWVADVQQMSQEQFLRLKHAQEAGIHGIVAIPVVSSRGMLAVMMFMSQQVLTPDKELLQILTLVLQQIAPIIEHQQAVAELTSSEERYRTLVENFDGVITIANADGVYLFANEIAWEPFGLGPNERENRSVHELFPKVTADLFVERVRSVIASGEPRVDIDGMMTGPDYRWFRSTIAPLHNADGTINKVLTIAFDITDVMEAEQKIRASEEKYRRIVETAQEGIWLFSEDSTITYVNERMADMLGYTVEEMLGQRLENFIPSDDIQNMREQQIRRMQGISEQHDQILVCKDGNQIWVVVSSSPILDPDGRPVGALAMVTDITERKRSELALEQSARRLRILHSIDQSILQSDSIKELAANALELLMSLIRAQRVTVFMMDIDSRIAELVAYRSRDENFTLAHPEIVSMDHPNPIDQEIEQAIATERYHLIQDLDVYPVKFQQNLLDEGIQSILSIGLKYQSKLLGSMHIHAKEKHFFTPEIIQIVSEVADQIAIGIHTNELRTQLEAYANELEERVAQRTAELELEKTRIEAILQSSSDGILLLDEQLLIRQSNQTFCSIFGCDPSTPVGSPLLEFIHPADRELLAGQLQQSLNQNRVLRCEARAQRMDQRLLYVEIGIARVDPINGDSASLVCTIRDVTQRRQAEERLRESEARYRTTIATISEGIVLQTRDGVIQISNNAAEQILGLTADQMMGRTSTDPLWRAIHEDGSPFTGDTHPSMEVLRTGEPQSNVVMGVHKPDDTLVWILINSQPIMGDGDELPFASVTTFTDITERKAAQDALRESEARFRQIAENVEQVLFIRSRDDREILYINPAYEKLWGKSRASLYADANTFIDPVHPDDRDFVLQQLQKPRYLEEGYCDFEYRLLQPGGELRWIWARTFPIHDQNGQLIRRVGIAEDITERKQLEETLKRSLEKEMELSELKSRFVSIASHEFRTPLATILATTETLINYRDRLQPEQLDKRLQKILDQVGHMTTIMEDVLHLARIQAGRMEFNPIYARLDELCREIIEEFESQKQYEGRIIYEVDENITEIAFDTRLMRHSVVNLISNALKYSPSDEKIRLELVQTPETLRLSVSDKGIGIPAKDRRRLFEPFHRAENVGMISGTGLGLSIIKEAVQLHGGEIQVESELNQGTTFTLILQKKLSHGTRLGSDAEDES